jgi:enamine deaminase RidA (YjgF/YER057c/UK114 family)
LDDVGRARACSTVVGRFAGAESTELSMLCRPAEGSDGASRQAEAVYGELAALLAAERASALDLAGERLFLRDVRRDLPLVLEVRTRVLAAVGLGSKAPPPVSIQQAPADAHSTFELAASVVIPRRRDAWAVEDVPATPSCGCEGCRGSGARLVRLGDHTSVYTTNVHGTGGDALAEASSMFHEAERLLEQCGMGFSDVVRTWIHLRDIARDYDALNRARREFFRTRAVEPRPASTGVQGAPFPDAHDFAMSLWAVRSARSLDRQCMSTRSLAEAWSYGADFSRGLRVVDANRVTLHVSGTASIDEAGRTVHVGDLDGQVDRMLHNVAALLAEQGATFAHVLSAVAYLKDPGDAALLRARCRERGFDGFPCAVVEAPLCRPELLCEVEAVAALPLATARA